MLSKTVEIDISTATMMHALDLFAVCRFVQIVHKFVEQRINHISKPEQFVGRNN